jgi:hypothetical protein
LILGRESITGLLVLLINRRGLLLVGTSLASSCRLITAITFGRKMLPVRLTPTHIICLIIICVVTEGLGGYSRLFIFGNC